MSSFSANLIAGCARALAGPTVHWPENRSLSRQNVFFANHSSHLDFVVLWSALPRDLREKTRPVAAKNYWDSGLRKRLAVKVFHSVLVERNAEIDEHDRATAASCTLEFLLQALGTDNSLIIFPEGGRGDGLQVAPFKSGLFHLWRQRQDVAFIPVYLTNLNRILPKGEILPVPLTSQVTFGQPLQLGHDETKESFLMKAHAALCALGNA